MNRGERRARGTNSEEERISAVYERPVKSSIREERRTNSKEEANATFRMENDSYFIRSMSRGER